MHLKRIVLRSSCFTLLLLLITGPLDIWLTNYFHRLNLHEKSVLKCWDTLLHGCIAAISWLEVLLLCPAVTVPFNFLNYHFYASSTTELVINVFLAFAVSCIVDLDHILPGHLSEFMNLCVSQPWRRGLFHYSFPIIVATFFSLSYTCYSFNFSISKPFATFQSILPTTIDSNPGTQEKPVHFLNHAYMTAVCLLVLVSVLSHHVRDAVRHGLWFDPLIRTCPLSHVQYSFATVMLPLGISVFGWILFGFEQTAPT